MYLEHFGLRELPFTLTPDTAFFLNRAGYQDALNVLLVALRSGEGFVKVTGEVGTGKTLLCRKLLNTLGGEFHTAYLHNPYLEPHSLLRAAAEELEVTLPDGADQHQLLGCLARRLLDLHAQGRRVVLCLDEVQAMPAPTLETLRLITNLETEKRKLLQVVLFGQPELDTLLAGSSVRQLRQRITFSYRLLPMSRAALDTYVAHRLGVAGLASGQDCGEFFTRAALDRVHAASGGIPRLVNVLCHKSLMAAFGKGEARVSAACARMAVGDTASVAERRGLAGRWRGAWAWAAAGVLGGFLGAVGLLQAG